MNMRPDDILHDADENSAELRGVLGATADRLRANLAMDRPLHQITARGRLLRNKRRCAVGVAGVAAAAAIALGATGLPGAALGTGQHPTAAKGLNVDLAGFSVQTESDGTIAVTVKQFVFDDAPQLQHYLDEAGINAVVESMPIQGLYGAKAAPPPCPGPDEQMSSLEQTQLHRVLELPLDHGELASGDVFGLHPAAMPAGSTFAIFLYTWQGSSSSHPGFVEGSFGLYDGAVPNCSASPTA